MRGAWPRSLECKWPRERVMVSNINIRERQDRNESPTRNEAARGPTRFRISTRCFLDIEASGKYFICLQLGACLPATQCANRANVLRVNSRIL